MKCAIFFLLIVYLTATGCNTGNKPSNLLHPNNLKSDQYIIDITRDTTLETKNGALLNIPKGALSSDEGNKVTLEIKEAYSMLQMVQSGLFTENNDNPLSSGGMIYINAVGGQKITITKPIKVAIPTDFLADSMQLFKGETRKDGTINWDDPELLPENKQLNSIVEGQQIFQDKCANCHGIGKNFVGPDLANIKKRRFFGTEGGYPEMHFNRVRRYQKSSNYFHSGICYDCNVAKMFGTLASPPFADLTQDEVWNIFNYIQNESDKKTLPLPSHAWLDDCIDSCDKYYSNIRQLEYLKKNVQKKKRILRNDNGTSVNIKSDTITRTISPEDNTNILDIITPPPGIDFEDRVSPEYAESEYYQFTIESFGWYNIDILLKNVNGVEESELFVRITGQYRQKIQVLLVIPSVKIYVQGGPTGKTPDEYAFFDKNGKIALPQDARAYIIAMTEENRSIAFSLKEFTTARQQQLEISLQQSTIEEFRAAIKNIELDSLKIQANESKNAREIRKADKEIEDIEYELKNAEYMKPKGCDCECGFLRSPVVADTSLKK